MASYLDWMKELFDEAAIDYTPESASYLDKALRKISGVAEGASEEQVYRKLRARWLNHGQPGRQLLVSLLRDEVHSRRDSPMRPQEGDAYYTHNYMVTDQLPVSER
jgi:hypothetical protein